MWCSVVHLRPGTPREMTRGSSNGLPKTGGFESCLGLEQQPAARGGGRHKGRREAAGAVGVGLAAVGARDAEGDASHVGSGVEGEGRDDELGAERREQAAVAGVGVPCQGKGQRAQGAVSRHGMA